MRLIVMTCLALALSAVSSAAQTVRPNVTTPQLPPAQVIPVEPEGRPLERPPEGPRPTDELIMRKLELLQGFGMTAVTEAWLRWPMLATPNRRTSNASLEVLGGWDSVSVLSPTGMMPHGSVRLPTFQSPLVVHAAASVRRWLLVQCIVDLDLRAEGVQFDIHGTQPAAATQMDGRHLVLLYAPAVGTEIEFRLEPNDRYRIGRDEWLFGGCEITPVEPP